MKVGLICPYSLDFPGGVQGQVRLLADELRRRGHEAVIVGPGVDVAPPVELRIGGTVSTPGNGSVAPLLLNPSRQGAFLEAVQPMDVLHVQEPSLPALGWWAARSGIPQVHTFHADAPRGRGALARVILRTLPSPSSTTAVSEIAAANWNRRAEIIPNAVEHVGLSSDRNPGQVVCIGRDEPRKGINVLLAAWPKVLKAVPHAQLHLTSGARSSDGITQHGRLSKTEKWELLTTSEVAVSPNRFGESFGLVVAEALACGTPLVMSDLPAFRAVAGTAAVTVPAGDAVALATAIVALLQDPAERERRSAQGREVVRRFSVGGVVDRYLPLYAEAIDQG